MKYFLRSEHFKPRHNAFAVPFFGAALFMVLLTFPAHAVLAPNVEAGRELAFVTEAVGKRFPGQPIQSITRQDFGSYDVRVGACRLKARIVTLPTPQGMVGPRQYTVRLTRPKCAVAKQ
ncbi:MAG TPA: hypothetical protein GXX48_18135 [Ochrobactrum intermedium]|uniref:Uncharacterized protein n=2 Tax=Brucella intermedia TaxID=94625 RepID=A0A7V6PEM2_9HYPH|nr:hypothetical protein [Brucella intermedia]